MEHFASFDGTTIAYLDTGGVGAPVLLLHGFASDHVGNWVRPGVVDALIAAGRRVLAPDARGHGASEKPHDPERYADNAMSRDASALVDHLGLECVDVVGYSMGAIVSSRVARKDSRTRSLVLSGVGGRLASGRAVVNAGALADALLAEDLSGVPDVAARAFRRFADRTGADRAALAAMQTATRRHSIGRLDEITVPTLVLVGRGDTLAGDPADLAARINGARSAVVGGDHLTAMYDPAFAPTIVEFLASVP
jgi:pimeloyl-ACP methyl ester carboxylesterase